MKRTLLIALGVFGIFTIVNAQKGIRVESHNIPVIVYINNSQMCTPVNSCFVANLDRGTYQVDVYDAADYHGRRDRPLLSEKIRYSGFGIEEINIDTDIYADTDKRPHRPNNNRRNRLMSEQGFNEFIKSIKSSAFNDTKNDLIRSVLPTTDFTCEQARKISSTYSPNKEHIIFMKIIYPNIIDKPNFYTVINTMTFDSSKKEVAKYIEKYQGDK